MIDDDAGGHTTGVQTAARVIEASKAYFVIGSFVLYFVIRLLLPLIEMDNASRASARAAIHRPAPAERARTSLLARARPPRAGRTEVSSPRDDLPPTAA